MGAREMGLRTIGTRPPPEAPARVKGKLIGENAKRTTPKSTMGGRLTNFQKEWNPTFITGALEGLIQRKENEKTRLENTVTFEAYMTEEIWGYPATYEPPELDEHL